MIRLIGGTARTGKSTLARGLMAAEIAGAPDQPNRGLGNILDMDHLRWALSVVGELQINEELESPDSWRATSEDHWHMAMDSREDTVLQIAGRYGRAANWVKEDLLLVGICRPSHGLELLELGIPVRAVYLVDTAIQQRVDRLLEDPSPENWLGDH